MIDRTQIILAYQLLLDRDPEEDGVVEAKSAAESLDAVILEMVSSDEFMSRHHGALLLRFG